MGEPRKAPERLLTADEVADHLGFKTGTIYQKVSQGTIPYVKLGRAVRFRLSEIEEWIRGQEAASEEIR
jgi:excisionase family DNA binding protein